MGYDFQGCLYRTRYDLAAAVAGEWLSAGGANSLAEIAAIADDDAEIVDEIIVGWELTPQWLETRSIDRSMLVRAVREYRAQVASDIAADATTTEAVLRG